ncbi:Hercynine oxygenase [subsurface metagenome]
MIAFKVLVFMFFGKTGIMIIRAILALAAVWLYMVCIISAQAANPADIYPDNKVDWLDMKIIGDNWLSTDLTPADIDNSGDVNAVDYAILANNWGWVGTPAPNDMVFVYINDAGISGHESFTGYMSKYETTNAQYCQFLNAANVSGDITVLGGYIVGYNGSNSGADFVGQKYYDPAGPGYDWPRDGSINGGAARINYIGGVFTVDSGFDNHPVTYVSWYGATAFCNYYGYRLPTLWEWQAVADYDGSFNYGCGPSINNSIANYYNSIHPDGTTVVGSFGTYGYGMCDMAGNVWEWTSSAYNYPYYFSHYGGWVSKDNYCTVSSWYYNFAYFMYCTSGFRVCR